MKKSIWKMLWFAFALAIPMGYQNCSPSSFMAADRSLVLSSAVTSMASCMEHASGSRWWELDPVVETQACAGGGPISKSYYLEKLCNNSVVSSTGQRVASGTNPVCQTVCQSTTASWTSVEGQLQQTVACAGGVTASAIHERLVQYACVGGLPKIKSGILVGNKISGGCMTTPSIDPCLDADGNPQSKGAIWQERTSDLKFSQSCPGKTTLALLSCERFLEYQCVGGAKQLTSREVVAMNCNPIISCDSGNCTTSTGTYPSLATWTVRISPDFSDPGVCTAGGDLILKSERLQIYQCVNGSVETQQVIRGASLGQTGQCGPKTCTVTNGTGNQNWTTINGVDQWGPCGSITCNAGYELIGNQCLTLCPAGTTRDTSTLICTLNPLKIRIITATYGDNWGEVPKGNATAHMKSVCDNKTSCSYLISTANLGDPKHGWSKSFHVDYDCTDGVIKHGDVNPEANTSTLTISCAAP